MNLARILNKIILQACPDKHLDCQPHYYSMSFLSLATGRIAKRNTQRLSSNITIHQPANTERVEMLHDEVNAHNVGVATTLSILRVRARDLRAEYTRMWRCYTGVSVQPFLYDSPEGSSSYLSRTQNLRDYIEAHVRRLEDLRAKVMRNPEAKARWIKSNKGGGVLRRQLRARSQAVVTDLAHREGELERAVTSSSTSGPSALAQMVPCARAQSEKDNESHLQPAVCAKDTKFLRINTDIEEDGVKKPTTGVKLIAARIRAQNVGDLDAVRSIDDQLAFRAAKGRARRHRAKARKRALKECIKSRVPDPPSGDEI